MAVGKLTVDVRGMPEVVWKCRKALANLLREMAEGEPQVVSSKLKEAAARFEAGEGQA